ncbi:MAG: J domain-containing protein [Actinomycetota bacterium]|nr:J domain-containing protein [Actinomycetota bacterium]HZY64885.1 J domain-containing protein [Rubrobacteraceae bacterium]
MSIPRRLGRLARGFVLNLQEDDRLRETLRVGRERGETLRDTFGDAFEAAWRGAAEEWRAAEEERRAEEAQRGGEERRASEDAGRRSSSRGDSYWRSYSSTTFAPRKFPPPVLNAYERLGLLPGASLEEISRKRRDLIKRYHPDRFSDPDKRVRAERLTAEINAAHDTIARYLYKKR